MNKQSRLSRHMITASGVLLLAALATPTQNAVAARSKFPNGCRQKNFHFNANLLELTTDPNGLQQTIYLIHNITHHDIKLEVTNPSKYQPTYQKIIPYNRWAVLAKDEIPLQMVCTGATTYDDIGYSLDCAQVIELCNYNNAKFPEQNLGTYWLDRTGSQRQAMRHAIRKGILLRW